MASQPCLCERLMSQWKRHFAGLWNRDCIWSNTLVHLTTGKNGIPEVMTKYVIVTVCVLFFQWGCGCDKDQRLVLGCKLQVQSLACTTNTYCARGSRRGPRWGDNHFLPVKGETTWISSWLTSWVWIMQVGQTLAKQPSAMHATALLLKGILSTKGSLHQLRQASAEKRW